MGFTIDIGTKGPSFRLPGVDGREHSLDDYADKKVVIVCFTCNHCPTAQATEDRIIVLQRDYADRGVALIAISSNETKNHPTDDFPYMVERAKEKGFNFPYLWDTTQEVAKAYGAQRTPHFFLLGSDRTVLYTGTIDDNPNDSSKVTRHYLREATDSALEGRPVPTPVTAPVGCNVKWWGKDPHWMPRDLSDFD